MLVGTDESYSKCRRSSERRAASRYDCLRQGLKDIPFVAVTGGCCEDAARYCREPEIFKCKGMGHGQGHEYSTERREACTLQLLIRASSSVMQETNAK